MIQKIYHGSDHIIEHPVFGAGKTYNDYGLGFYCTDTPEMAKEWGVSKDKSGYGDAEIICNEWNYNPTENDQIDRRYGANQTSMLLIFQNKGLDMAAYSSAPVMALRLLQESVPRRIRMAMPKGVKLRFFFVKIALHPFGVQTSVIIHDM